MSNITAQRVVLLLSKKHEDDIFVPECNTGAWSSARMDAWAMKKSWSNPSFIGYEVKVSRSDFLNDNKWPKYLDFCTQFYFVCPYGLIDPAEVGDNVGLMYVSKTGARLYTKKKAPYREINHEDLDTLYRSLLFNRVKITPSTFGRKGPQSRKEFWEQWLVEKKLDGKFGYNVSRSIKERVDKEIHEVRRENEKLKAENEAFQGLRDELVSKGYIKERGRLSYYDIKSITEKVESVVPDDLKWIVDRSINTLSDLKRRLEEGD
jgi:cell division protein FtsB